jgi:hypothetical protein
MLASPPRNRPQTPTTLKQPCLGQGPKGIKSHKEFWQRSKCLKYHWTSHENINLGHNPHTLLQWVISVHSISRILQRHLSTIFTLHHHHQPKPRNPPITIAMSSRRVKSLFTIRIDLLNSIVVTFETSHRLMSRLKAEAYSNTVTRKEGRFYSQSRTLPDDFIHRGGFNTIRPKETSWRQKQCATESIKFQNEIAYDNCTAKRIQSHKEISWRTKSMKSHKEIS